MRGRGGIGREHARIAKRNLDIVLAHREVLDRVPGASLMRLPGGQGQAGEEEEEVPAASADKASKG